MTAKPGEKVDLRRMLPAYGARRGEFRFLDVPPTRYVMVDGQGDPNTSSDYAAALAVLYPVAYAVKAASRRDIGRDHVVPPLEALWWAPDMAAFTSARDKSRWSWTTMLMVPDWVPDGLVQDAVAVVAVKRPEAPVDRVRLELLEEARCVQTLHVGPYDAEATVLAEMHDRVIPDAGLQMTGKHHEIYLGDPRRTAPSRLRTILRQPVTPFPTECR